MIVPVFVTDNKAEVNVPEPDMVPKLVMVPVLARVPELDSIPVIVKAMLELTELSTVNESPEFSVRLAIRQVEFVAVQVPESGAV